ncbi:MAG: DUF72 domain-containing protein [Terriglobales bacterium]
MSCDIRIGASGYHYRHWKGNFYPEDLATSGMLPFYLNYFDTLELNNTFYRLPTVAALEAWRDAVPDNFIFAVKASRFLTHNKKLKDPENALENLLPRIKVLGKKLGPILFQLPPKWRINLERLQELLAILPPKYKYAFEFRELSWINEQVLETLQRYSSAFCIYEIAGYHSPLHVTTDFAYVRLHGPGGKYQGSYSDAALEEWAEWIAEQSTELRAIYFYFDNDQAGYAPQNALTLRRKVAERLGIAQQAPLAA